MPENSEKFVPISDQLKSIEGEIATIKLRLSAQYDLWAGADRKLQGIQNALTPRGPQEEYDKAFADLREGIEGLVEGVLTRHDEAVMKQANLIGEGVLRELHSVATWQEQLVVLAGKASEADSKLSEKLDALWTQVEILQRVRTTNDELKEQLTRTEYKLGFTAASGETVREQLNRIEALVNGVNVKAGDPDGRVRVPVDEPPIMLDGLPEPHTGYAHTLKSQLGGALSTLKGLRPEAGGARARKVAVLITDLEKLMTLTEAWL